MYVWEPRLSLQGKNSLFTLLSEIQLFKDERFCLQKKLMNLIIKYQKRLFLSHKLQTLKAYALRKAIIKPIQQLEH